MANVHVATETSSVDKRSAYCSCTTLVPECTCLKDAYLCNARNDLDEHGPFFIGGVAAATMWN